MSAVRSFSHLLVRRQVFDYFLVLDFEATCDSGGRKVVSEIIEFPVLLVDAKSLKEVARFHQFVKPRICTTLSHFCVTLTGITQETVDAAQPLPRVWKNFTNWLQEHELVTQDKSDGDRSSRSGNLVSVQNFAVATCGNWVSDGKVVA